jgi:ABC-2 type transport system ATP-binding protein
LGEEIKNDRNPVFSRIGSIIETPVFYGNFNARKNLELHCGYMGVKSEYIDETLSLLGLSGVENKPVKNYSLGMKQRLALARAFLSKPELLILDEPINGLDP